MKRNIVTTVTLGTGQIKINSIEIIGQNYVDLFCKVNNNSNSVNFLVEGIKELEKKVGGKIEDVFVVVEPSTKINYEISIYQDQILGDENLDVSAQINNKLKSLYQAFKSNTHKTIQVQPIEFTFSENGVDDTYTELPRHKNFEKCNLTTVVTNIDNNTYSYIKNLFKNAKLNIKQIFLAPQIIPFEKLSTNAINDGVALLHIDYGYSFIAVVKNSSVIDLKIFENLGYKHLIKGISSMFGTDGQKTLELLETYGNFGTIANKESIHIRQDEQGAKEITNYDLNFVLKKFMESIIERTNDFLTSKDLNDLPFVISGNVNKIHGLESFISSKANASHINVYKPMTYIETLPTTTHCLGVTNFIERFNQVMGIGYNTIVDTNPNIVLGQESPIKKSFKGLGFIKQIFKSKLGGRQEYV